MTERGRFDALPLALLAAAACWFAAPYALHPESLAVLGAPGAAPAAAADEPLARGLRGAARWLAQQELVPLRVDTFTAVRALVIAAAALAAFWLHAAARRLCGRSAAVHVVLLALACPATVVAATAVHGHALGFLLAAVAVHGALATVQQPAWWRAVLLGLWFATSHWLTPRGALLPLVALPFALCLAPPPAGARRRTALLVLLAVVLWLTGAALLLDFDLGRGLPRLEQVAAMDLGSLGPLLLRDVGRDLLPLSWVLVALLWSRTHHRPALCLLGAASLLLVVGCHQTETLGDDGAFALALVPPAALLAGHALTARLRLVLVVLALAASGAKLWVRSERSDAQAFVGGLLRLCEPAPSLVLSGPRRDQAFLLHLAPDVQTRPIAAVCAVAPERAADAVAELLAAARAGNRLLLLAEAEAALRDPAWRARHAAAAPVLRELEARFTFTFVGNDGCHASLLTPR